MSLDWSLMMPNGDVVFDMNITHNVTPMWEAAGVYRCFYDLNGTHAVTHKICFQHAFRAMRNNFAEYEKLNAPNGWGKAEHALNFLAQALLAVRKYPEAIIHISK